MIGPKAVGYHTSDVVNKRTFCGRCFGKTSLKCGWRKHLTWLRKSLSPLFRFFAVFFLVVSLFVVLPLRSTCGLSVDPDRRSVQVCFELMVLLLAVSSSGVEIFVESIVSVAMFRDHGRNRRLLCCSLSRMQTVLWSCSYYCARPREREILLAPMLFAIACDP